MTATGSGDTGVVDEFDGAPVFVHDFAAVAAAWPDGPARFATGLTPPVLSQLVTEAWNNVTSQLQATGLALEPCDPTRLRVGVGVARHRDDAVVIPVWWRPAAHPWVAPLDADLEIARFSPSHLHLHLLGRSRLPVGVRPGTAEASLHQRLAVAVVRHVLGRMVDAVTPFPLPTRPASPLGPGGPERAQRLGTTQRTTVPPPDRASI